MTILVVYDTRFGFTTKCLTLLREALDSQIQLELWPTSSGALPPQGSWDALVVGGPIYHGRFRRQLREFLLSEPSRWARFRHVHAFSTGLSDRATAIGILKTDLEAALGVTPEGRWFFGGQLAWAQLGWWDRMTLNLSRGLQNEVSNLNLPEIQALAVVLGKL